MKKTNNVSDFPFTVIFYTISKMSKLVITLYVLTTSLALLALKWGTRAGAPIDLKGNGLQFNINFYNVSGIILYVISFALYIYLISRFDLGYIIPLVTAFVYIAIFIGSYVIFHEAFTPAKIFGIALIFGGLVLLNLNR